MVKKGREKGGKRESRETKKGRNISKRKKCERK